MADAETTRYALVKPEVGASSDTWGSKWNTNADDADALLSCITTTGSANAYVLTTGLSLAAYVSGQSFLIKANFTNSGAATINVDGLGAKSLVKGASTALVSGDITSGAMYRIAYDGTNFIVLNAGAGSYQPLDATLTALAALSWSSGSPLVQFTAADTVSLTASPTIDALTISSATALLTLTDTTTPVTVTIGVNADNAGAIRTTTSHPLDFYANNTFRLRITTGGQIQVNVDGSNSAPAWTFVNDPDCGWYRIGTNNWAGAVGGTKFVDYSTTLVAYSLPVQARIPLSSETSGTLTVASANKKILATGGITLPNSVFAAEDTILIDGNGTNRTITRGSGVTMYVGGVDSATATLAANGVMGVSWRTASICILTGNVS